MELEQGEHCLICCSEILPVPPDLASSSCSLLDKHLEVIFLLRKVLEVPVAQLARFLEGCPSVEGWISVCDSCAEAVKQCKVIYQELLEANRKWRECKQEIVGVIKATSATVEKTTEDNQSGSVLDIERDCRQFVKKHDYEPFLDPFIAGDLKAKELLIKTESTADDQELSISPCAPSPKTDDSFVASATSEDDNDSDYSQKKKKPAPSSSKTRVPGVRRKRVKKKPAPAHCHICNLTVFCSNTLKTHLYHAHSIGELKHKCHLCQRSFKRSLELEIHSKKCQGTVRHTHPDDMPHFNHFRIKCAMPGCSQTWPIISAYRAHMRTVHTPEEKLSLPLHRRKIFECLTCGKLMVRGSTYTHVFSHNPALKKEFICDVCGTAFTVARHLANHKKHTLACKKLQGLSESEATVICDICGNRYANETGLRLHITQRHRKQFKRHCQHCGKGFPDNVTLTVHLASAHGIVEDKKVELKCPVEGCGKIFYHRRNWRDHQKGVHKQGEPEYKCKQCGKAFYIYKGLSQHVNVVHRGYRRKPKIPKMKQDESNTPVDNQ